MASWLARLSAGGVMRSAPSACSRARVGMVAGWELEPVRSVPSVVLDRDSEAGANLRSAEIVELNAGCSLRSTHNRKPLGAWLCERDGWRDAVFGSRRAHEITMTNAAIETSSDRHEMRWQAAASLVFICEPIWEPAKSVTGGSV